DRRLRIRRRDRLPVEVRPEELDGHEQARVREVCRRERIGGCVFGEAAEGGAGKQEGRAAFRAAGEQVGSTEEMRRHLALEWQTSTSRSIHVRRSCTGDA